MPDLRYVQVLEYNSSDRFKVGDFLVGTESKLRLLLDGSNLWNPSWGDYFWVSNLYDVLHSSDSRIHFIESVDFSGFKIHAYRTPKTFAKSVLGITV